MKQKRFKSSSYVKDNIVYAGYHPKSRKVNVSSMNVEISGYRSSENKVHSANVGCCYMDRLYSYRW